ncbi:MAG: apolipoprotein N-acyltransferase [Angustibacter sp.]
MRAARLRRWSPHLLGVLGAVAAGLISRLAFPDPGWWPLAPLGVALWFIVMATHPSIRSTGRRLFLRRARSGALLGGCYGLAFFLPLVSWSGVYVGPLPWLALATLQAGYLALLGAALTAVVPTARDRIGTAVLGSAGAAALFVGQEALRARTPFGGFPWGRIAFSQADSPFGHLAAWGGAPLVGCAAVWCGGLAAWAGLSIWRVACQRAPGVPGVFGAIAGAGMSCLLVLSGWVVPLPVAGSPVQVAGVQGGVARPGLDFNAERREVLDNHARGTVALATRVDEGRSARPDLVIWPENSSDLDPFEQVDARSVIDGAVNRLGAPTLVGAVLRRPAGRLTNASIVWTPGRGPGEWYAKRHPVPFAEYIPYRGFFRRISSQVDLVRTDFAAGDRVGVLPVGPVRAGVAICFEVAYDDLLRDTVREGADLLVVQTNNATFGDTDEAVQQLAMSRLRAIEHGRAVAHVSTVGVSALILPDGREVATAGLLTTGVVEARLPRRTSLTVADRLGGWVEGGITVFGVTVLLLSQRRTRRRPDSQEVSASSPITVEADQATAPG